MKLRLLIFLLASFTLINCSNDDTSSDGESSEETDDTSSGGDDDQATVTGDPEELVFNIQRDFLKSFSQQNFNKRDFIRHENMFGIYAAAFNGSGSNFWVCPYNILDNTRLLEQLNEQQNNNIPYHTAIGNILSSYIFIVLVDNYNSIPYTNSDFETAPLDSGSSVYQQCIAKLDEAINLLNSQNGTIPQDIFFSNGFQKQNWIRIANTLKIRAYTNLRLINPSESREKINAILSQDFIDLESEDFEYIYGSVNLGTLYTDHPLFGNYTNQPGSYMSNDLFDYMNVGDELPPYIETGEIDPRARYYFYRQRDEAPTGSNLACEGDDAYYYCYVGNLYWGRDHGDTEGIPNDSFSRTTYGIYPIGGAFDKNEFINIRVPDNLEGQGILPFILSSFTNFLLAENSLTIDINGSTSNYLEMAIRQSLEKVKAFGDQKSTINPDTNVDYAMTQSDIDEYVNRTLLEFNSATNDQKLQIIAREYYIAAYGNSLEIYNLYRRTGKPEFNPVVFDPPNVDFPRIMPYPINALVNPNINQQQITEQVFWDNNPPDFID